MKKELFETAEMEVIEFDQTDIIITSDDSDEYEGDMVDYIHFPLI
jgi:hypothetical protein